MKSFMKIFLCVLVFLPGALMYNTPRTAAATSFKDISASHRSYKEIMYLAQGKITTGNAKGCFEPSKKVTRAEFAAMIGRTLGLNGTKRKTKFRDVGVNNFASGYIQEAVDRGIISGYPGGVFKPNGLVTRGEMAIIICRAFGYSFNNTTNGAGKVLIYKGIDKAMSDGTFGTARQGTREETAIFIARAVDYRLRLKPTSAFNSTSYVNTSSLNIRKGPSTNYSVVGSVKNKEKVSVTYKVGNWTMIKSKNNVIGFVSTAYLTNVPPSSPEGNTGNNNTGSSLASQVLVIDPGHGGKDAGAVGYNLTEKYVVLDTGLRLKQLLAKTPFNVKYTRQTDVFIELSQRVAIAKNAKANAFVSIHSNAANGNASGSETYYYGPASKTANPNVAASQLLAKKIQKRLVAAMGTKDRGDKHGDYHVLRENSMPAVLVELGFIDNKADNAKLASPTYRQKAAQAIYYGILDYYGAKGFNVAKYY